jgi:hypothetical protein
MEKPWLFDCNTKGCPNRAIICTDHPTLCKTKNCPEPATHCRFHRIKSHPCHLPYCFAPAFYKDTSNYSIVSCGEHKSMESIPINYAYCARCGSASHVSQYLSCDCKKDPLAIRTLPAGTFRPEDYARYHVKTLFSEDWNDFAPKTFAGLTVDNFKSSLPTHDIGHEYDEYLHGGYDRRKELERPIHVWVTTYHKPLIFIRLGLHQWIEEYKTKDKDGNVVTAKRMHNMDMKKKMEALERFHHVYCRKAPNSPITVCYLGYSRAVFDQHVAMFEEEFGPAEHMVMSLLYFDIFDFIENERPPKKRKIMPSEEKFI